MAEDANPSIDKPAHHPEAYQFFTDLHTKPDAALRVAQRLVIEGAAKICTRGKELGLLQVQFRAYVDAGCSVLGYLPYPSGEELAQSALKKDWKHMEDACSSKASGAFMQQPGWVGKGQLRTLTFRERIQTLDAEAISKILGAHAKNVSEAERVSMEQAMQRAKGK